MSFILIALAAIFKAASDVMMFHYSDSVFNYWDYKFWDPSRSWRYAKKIFKYPVDSWHLSNSLMIVCFVLAAVFPDKWNLWYLQFIVFGISFNIVFNIFYNWVFR